MKLILTGTPSQIEQLYKEKKIKSLGPDFSIDDQRALMLADQMTAIIIVDGKEVFWNPAKERDPRIKDNENGGKGAGKGGFRYSPYYHAKGIFLQNVVKKGIIRAIDMAHRQTFGKYDLNAFELSDPRLVEINAYLRAYVDQKFQHMNGRKQDFMNKIIDMGMFLVKEDPYYRARFLEMLRDMPRFDITDDEAENIQRWK